LKTFANIIKAIFVKDLLSEFRTKQVLPAMIMLGVLIAWIFRITTQSAAADTSVAASAALLAAILFSAILLSEKSFAVESENGCLDALVLASADTADIYIGKLIANVTILCIFELVAAPAVLVLFKINANLDWPRLVITLLLIDIGISGIGTLLGCAVQGTRAANSLLSVLVMVLLCPMMIPAVSALHSLFSQPAGPGTLALAGDFNKTLAFLVAFDAIFVTVCWLLFGFLTGPQEK
jgi:heme exporter protein B